MVRGKKTYCVYNVKKLGVSDTTKDVLTPPGHAVFHHSLLMDGQKGIIKIDFEYESSDEVSDNRDVDSDYTTQN